MASNNLFDEIGIPSIEDATATDSGANLFDEISIEPREESPFEQLPKGISPETPEGTNLFDAIGYEAPPEPSYQKVGDYRGAEILQDEGGKWYSKSEQGIVELPEEVKGQVQAELGGLEEPWIDPLTVAGGAAGVGGRLAYRAGARGLELLGRTALSGGVAGIAEYPLGIVTEAVGEEHPELAPYVNIGLGILSGVTIENFVEKAIIGKGLTPTARAVNKYITELKAGIISDDVATRAASDITEEVKVKQPDIVDRIHGERAEEINKMQEARKAELRKGFTEPKPFVKGEPEPKDYKAEIKDRFPDADADDIAYVSREVAQDFRDIKDPRTQGNAQAWEKFAETGEEVGPRGGPEAFNFGKENFETKMREYLEFKTSVDEAAARAPEEVNAFDAIVEPPKEIPVKKDLQPYKEGDIFNIEETERRIKDGLYVHDRIPEAAIETNVGSSLESAGSIARGSLRTVPEIDAKALDEITDFAARKNAAEKIRKAESDALIDWAKAENRILDNYEQDHISASIKHHEKGLLLGGTDNYTYRDENTGKWLKANKFKFAPTYTDLMDRVKLHNTIFPETPYEFEGMAKVHGDWSPVLSQKHIIEDPGVTDERKLKLAEEYLFSRGFKKHLDPDLPEEIALAQFKNGDVIVTDIDAGNVIIKDGKPYIFDPVVYLDPATKSERLVGRKIEPLVKRPVEAPPVREEEGLDFGDISEELELGARRPIERPSEQIPGDVQAGSLAYGMPLPKQAASINLERVGADYSTKKMILDVSDQYKGQIDEARRGKITHETTRELAEDLGMTEKQLLKRRKGRAFNAEEALASRDILNTSAGNLVDLQKRIVADPTEENLALFKMAMEKHAAIQAEVSGVATEAGRALSAHRIQSAKDARVVKNYQKMLDVLGGRNNAEKLGRYFSTIDPTDQTAVNKFIMEMSEATTSEKVFEAWINGLLSGPQTHIVNTTSNALTFLSGIPERATGATLDLLRTGATGGKRERFYGEIPEHIYGAWHGMKEGITAGMKAFVTEIPTEDAMKLEIPRKMAIKGKKGRIIRLPGRSLMAMDEFFKAINYRAELHSLAFRQAAKEGIKGDARAKRIAEIVSKPSDELKEKATQEMLYRVFQKELGPSGKALTKLRTVTPGLKYIVPFLKTPTNIAKFGLERTPLSLARYPGMFKKLMKGELKGADITDEMAKTLMGSMIGLATFMYAKEGSITGGGPKNKADREALYRTGWQPYSLKIGNKHYSYGRLEPLGMVMGIAADASDIWDEMDTEEQENVAALIALSVSKNLTSKTFMKGLSDAMNATTDPARYGEKWVQGFIASGVPSIAAATTRAIDPELKEAQTILDKIKSRIPGVAGGLFPKRDIWGNAIERDLAGVAAMVSPVYIAEGKGTKADQEVVRLGVRIGKPSKKIGEQELTPEQYDRLAVEAGAEAKKRVDRFVNQTSYSRMNDEFKAKMIKRQYDGAVGFARRKLKRELRQKGE